MPNNDDVEREQSEEDFSPGSDELIYAISRAISHRRTKDAVAKLIENYAGEISGSAQRRHSRMFWSYLFTLLVMAAIGVLGWQKIITSETAGTLLGAVVGAIFYGRSSNN
jgi:hypothetical protein